MRPDLLGRQSGRQVEEFDLIGMVLHPGGDPVRPMDRQIVDDHEQLRAASRTRRCRKLRKIGALMAPS